jgi:hypothetical protein
MWDHARLALAQVNELVMIMTFIFPLSEYDVLTRETIVSLC